MSNELTAAGIAEKFNMWVRFNGKWHTPDSFRYLVKEETVKHVRRHVVIMNPVEALEKGRWVIINMVRRLENPIEIEKAIIKMGQFEEDIRRLYKHRALYPMEQEEAVRLIKQYNAK